MQFRAIILILTTCFITSFTYSQVSFEPPLRIPLSMSASFGELRPDHYHSGIDLKTQGVTGKEVQAADEGYVYLLIVSPVGYGRAIFIRHPSGYSTVYGHLNEFSKEIEDYVKKQQYLNRSFPVSLYPPPELFKVAKGQLIGYSGNTGGSSGPHLHFEVRKTDGEKPVNPLLFGFGIQDNLKPVIERLVIYPVTKSTEINGRRSKRVLQDVSGSNGHYYLPSGTVVRISGPAAFGITAYDYMNNTANRFGINTIQLTIDSIPWFSYSINEFSFYESRYINAHTDYEAAVRSNVDIERLYLLPNDKLSTYHSYMNSGIFDFSDGKRHTVSITVRDSKENQTTLTFIAESVQAQSDNSTQPSTENYSVMPYSKENIFTAEGVAVSIPAGALYDTLSFRYEVSEPDNRLISRVHSISDRYIPLHKPYKLTIKPDFIPEGKESKLLIARIDEKGRLNPVGGEFVNGSVTCETNTFGVFAIVADTVAPEILHYNFDEGADLSQRSMMRFRITDDLSGISSYDGYIDGQWALFEYDAKNNLLFYRFDPDRVKKGTMHTLELVVADSRKNKSRITRNFKW